MEDGERSSPLHNMQVILIHRWLRPSTRPFSASAFLQAKKKMPPKKAAAQEKKVLLGRPSNNLKIGIVGAFEDRTPEPALKFMYTHPGLPNVGKSSFFNALSNTGAFLLLSFFKAWLIFFVRPGQSCKFSIRDNKSRRGPHPSPRHSL